MLSMSEDDAAYTALLTQLLSDSASTRNARVHSWIEHQYDFAFSELPNQHHCPPAISRSPSPSPSSSLGAHRTFSIDRPDSPLLPRLSSDRPVSPRSESCPSYDALFFSPPIQPTEDEDLEERERTRALRFLVQEMAHWKLQNASATTLSSVDKPLPAPPPSPASSLTESTSSRPMRSRSSSMRISRLPSFTSTLSSDQSQLQDLPPPPLPVSVIVHGEYQHVLVLRNDMPYMTSSASPTTATFDSSACLPDTIPLPASPVEERDFFAESVQVTGHQRTPSCAGSLISSSTAFPASPSIASLAVPPPTTNVFPASPTSSYFPAVNAHATPAQPQHLRAPKSAEHSQSRWSVATTASLTGEPKSGSFLHPTSPPKAKKDRVLKTPKKRTRFINLISRFSPGRVDSSTTTSSMGDDIEYDSSNDSDNEEPREKSKKKPMSKKSSLASLRASFSVSRTSFSSQRPPLSSPIEEVPPLPISPSRTSFNASRPSLTELMGYEAVPPVPKVSPSQLPSRLNQARMSPLPPPSKRTSLASAADMVPTSPTSPNQTTSRSKSIFQLTTKPKSARPPAISGKVPASKLPKTGTSLPSPTSPTSRIPPPTKFTPPAKLATVIAAQSQKAPSSPAPPPASKLPSPPSRPSHSKLAPRAPLTISVEKASVITSPASSTPTASRLPMPASVKGTTRTGTVKGFWRRQ